LGAKANEGKALAPISTLIKLTGNPINGAKMFAQNCAVCHQVNDEGMDFGPKLSQIGAKFPKEGQYLSILHPDAGISFGYEGYEVKMKDGSTIAGIIASKTETDLKMKFAGGTVQDYKIADVKSMKKLENSMMTPVYENLSQEELVDVVEYLMTLK
jgi:putative heme-binding domain-containing protein